MCTLAGFASLLAASLILKCNASWRTIFMFGGMIAISGAVARRKLRESPDFVKSQLQKQNTDSHVISNRTSLAYFLTYTGYPLCFYLTYIYSADILKRSFNYKSEQIIDHNLMLTLLGFVVGVSLIFMVRSFKPLSILRIRGYLAAAVLFSIPLLPIDKNIYALTAMQILLILFALGTTPAIPIFFKHFPTHKRFTYSSMLYAVSRALMYTFTSFGLVYLVELLGTYGLWLITVPVSIGFLWGVKHFEKLESVQSIEEKLAPALAIAA